MKKFLSLMLALTLYLGLAVPASAFYSLTFDYGGFIDSRNESIPGVWDNTWVTYIKAESHVEISRYLEYEGEIQAVWVSVAGANDKFYFFERNAGDAPFESVVIPFTSTQTKDGKTINLSDSNKVYAVTVEATEPDGSKSVSTEYYRVVNEVNGEYVINDEAVYTNPLIFKSGLDYDDVSLRDDGYYKVEKGGKYGLLDQNGNELVPPVYDQLGEISDGMMKVYQDKDYGTKKCGFVDISTGELTIPIEYVDQAWNDGERSISDFSNGVAILSEAHVSKDPGDGLSTVTTRCGLIDKTGKIVVPMVYDSISLSTCIETSWDGELGVIVHITDFSDSLIVASKDGKTFVADLQGNVLFEPASDFIWLNGYYDGLAQIYKNDKFGFLDKEGRMVIPLKYDSADQFGDHSGYIRVGTKQGEKTQCGLIDRQGNLIVPMEYDRIDTFSEGMAAVYKDGKGGFVNLSGELVIPPAYDVVGRFQNGLARVGIADERFADIDSWQRKFGYIDKQGNVVIPIEYSLVSDFSSGFAVVSKGTCTMQYARNSSYGWLLERIEARFKELGVRTEYSNIDMSGNVIPSGGSLYDLNRYYVDKINGEFAIMRNPIYPENATPNRSTVLVNGEQVAFDAYTINQNNYFKLRDLAKVLSGTGKQFEVTWDGKANAINMLSGKPYTAVGGELAQGDGMDKTATVNTATVYLDGQPVSLLAYTINQNNYFKLRDVGQAFDFDVTWDGARNTIVIDTTQSYTAD